MKKAKILGFSLVELIIIITILIILSTVAFLNFREYPFLARDTARLTDLENIGKALNLIELETGAFPTPENPGEAIEIEDIEGIKWKKGKFGEQQFKEVKRLSNLPLDPKTKEKYDYYLSENELFYRLESIKEKDKEKIFVTNYIKNFDISNNGIGNSISQLNIPLTAKLYGNTEQSIDCKKDAGDRFTVSNGTIKDNLTGLYWEQNPSNLKSNWIDAKNKCANLMLGGYSDWKLPSKTELESIVNYSCYNPSTYTGFTLSSSFYWSSTTYANITNRAWGINFSGGDDNNHDRSNIYYFICVR